MTNGTTEFKADAVRQCMRGNGSMARVASEFDLTETALGEWVKRAEADAGKAGPEVFTSAEREELQQLRRVNKRLLMSAIS